MFFLAYPFREGLATVQEYGRWGFTDETGTMVIQPQFESASWFSGGLAEVWLGGTAMGYIDKNGNVIFAGRDLYTDDTDAVASAASPLSEEAREVAAQVGDSVVAIEFFWASAG